MAAEHCWVIFCMVDTDKAESTQRQHWKWAYLDTCASRFTLFFRHQYTHYMAVFAVLTLLPKNLFDYNIFFGDGCGCGVSFLAFCYLNRIQSGMKKKIKLGVYCCFALCCFLVLMVYIVDFVAVKKYSVINGQHIFLAPAPTNIRFNFRKISCVNMK